MATIKGVWVFNDILTLGSPTWFSATYSGYGSLAFQSNNQEFYNINKTSSSSYVTYQYVSGGEGYSRNIYNFTSNTWSNVNYKTVDFGETEQTVDNTFYNWFIANAKPQVKSVAEITYNGTTTSLEEGKTATMSCNGKVMASDIVVAFTEAGSITYNGKTTNVEAGKTATVSCNGKRMESDVVIGAPIFPTLAAPTISIDGDTLSIQDDEGLATSFDILVNGEVKSSISAGYTVGVYLEDSAGWTSNVTFEYSTDNGSTWTKVPLTYYETTKITGLEGGFKYRAYCDEGMLYIYENNSFVYSGYQTYTSANKTLTASINISISTGD